MTKQPNPKESLFRQLKKKVTHFISGPDLDDEIEPDISKGLLSKDETFKIKDIPSDMVEMIDNLIDKGCLDSNKIVFNKEGQIESLAVRCKQDIGDLKDGYKLFTKKTQRKLGAFIRKYSSDITYFRIKNGMLYALHLKDSVEKVPFDISDLSIFKGLAYIRAYGIKEIPNIKKILFFNKYKHYRFNKGEWISGDREIIGFNGEKIIYSSEGSSDINRGKTFQVGIDKNNLWYFWDEEEQRWIEEIRTCDLSGEDIRDNAVLSVDEQICQFINILKVDFVKEVEQQVEIHINRVIRDIQRMVEGGELVRNKYCDLQLGPLLLKNFRVIGADNIEIVLIREKPAFLKVYIDLTGKGNMYFIQNILVDRTKKVTKKKPYWIPIYKLDSFKNIRDTEELTYHKENPLLFELRRLIDQEILIEGTRVNIEFPYGRIERDLCIEEISDGKIIINNPNKRMIQAVYINLDKRNVFVVYDSRICGRSNGFGGSFSYLIKAFSIVSA